MRKCVPLMSTSPPADGTATRGRPLASSTFLAWSFVSIWGSGYLATKAGLQYAAPFTFLTLRFLCGVAILLPVLAFWERHERLRWPATRREWKHVIVAGLLMHAANLGGSHYAQFLGMSAGITALVLALQPLVTAMFAAAFMHERLRPLQWLGVLLGLLGVGLVVWHRIDVRAVTAGALIAVTTALVAITAGTLYQRIFCPTADLRAASLVQFAATAFVLAPLAFWFEGFDVRWSWALLGAILFLVVLGSIFASNALHTLMRRGEATRVTSLLYLTPLFAVALEWLMFGVVPSLLTFVGVVVTCAGVALTAWRLRPAGSAPGAT
jgi:drug/metabolite transporter (DMT)-like permease